MKLLRERESLERQPFAEVLQRTRELWRQGDGLLYQERLRDECDVVLDSVILIDHFSGAAARRHGLRLATRNVKDFPPARYSFVVAPYSLEV